MGRYFNFFFEVTFMSSNAVRKLSGCSPRIDSILSKEILQPKRTMSTFQLAVWVYLCVNAGPYGIESVLTATSPLILLGSILIIPWFWCLPTALITAELSVSYPNSNGGMIEWAECELG